MHQATYAPSWAFYYRSGAALLFFFIENLIKPLNALTLTTKNIYYRYSMQLVKLSSCNSLTHLLKPSTPQKFNIKHV